MKKTYITLMIGLTLLACGFLSWQLRDSNAFMNAQPAPPLAPRQTVTLQGEPVQLRIPSLNMTLPIINGEYNSRTHQWTLSLDKVQYAVTTPQPNNNAGNTFLYGHNRPEVFAHLHDIQPKALAYVTTRDGHIFKYQLRSVKVTKPEDTSIFDYKGPPILTIQTCSGLFFQNRQLFTFKLINAV